MLKPISSEWLESLAETLLPKGATPALVANIRALSSRYRDSNSNKLESLWLDQRMIEAYLAYFLPLNWLRSKAVIAEALKIAFFEDIHDIVEIGSGPGTFHFAALEAGIKCRWQFNDVSTAMATHQNLLKHLPFGHLETSTWAPQSPKKLPSPHTAIVLSYALNEIGYLPELAYGAEAICIIEPSTRETTRALQTLRAQLIEKGFYAWAPCTHDRGCPLLLHSPNDWCHTRSHVEVPKWLNPIENAIPVRNDTLTFSYLLMRRQPPMRTNGLARVIGDTLFERGKVRQAVCRGDEREFLSWLTRYGEPEPISRGATIVLPSDIEKKGNELRPKRD